MPNIELKPRLNNKPLQVAVGVVQDTDGRILISRRSPEVHQGGLWEFPGGKIEQGESVEQALARELFEELAIRAEVCQPLINITHQYPDLQVQLHVRRVTAFSGQAQAMEGQRFVWVDKQDLALYDFPEANKAIVNAVTLPRYYAILDDSVSARLLPDLETILNKGVVLVQARLKQSSERQIAEFIERAEPLCRRYQAEILLNSALDRVFWRQAQGVHLTAYDLMNLTDGASFSGRLAASCHNLGELLQAEKIGVDFAVLAPVLTTKTHPGQAGIGWQHFAEMVARVNIPVYALGGMTFDHYSQALTAGAQGISGIRLFLD